MPLITRVLLAIKRHRTRRIIRRIRWQQNIAIIARGPVAKRPRGHDEIHQIYIELEQAADA